ncbi:MAG TPA: bifunctional diguanylate cyclase/phosphodiesterase [Vicinamibacteria bacterium]
MEQGLLQGPWTRRPTSLAADRGRRFGSSASGRDPVTGLPDRRALFHSRETARSSPLGLAALVVGLDRFRRVNEALGLGAGDELLCLVADRLRACVRPGDALVRAGADEFALLLEGVPTIEDAVAAAHRIEASLRTPFSVAGQSLAITASIGVARSDGASREDVLRDAGIALRVAKGSGRDRVRVFEPGMRTAALARLRTESELEQALDRGELRVRYQPIVETGSGRLTGFEALARWEHPHRGELGPGDFIPIAEESGLIGRLGERVLAEACAQASSWRAETGRDLTLHVNLSAGQLRGAGLVERIFGILQETGWPPSLLHLEITESTVIEDEDLAVARLHQLRRRGVRVAIDDFGTGYSSLGLLGRLAVDGLKIDRTFVARLDGSDPRAAIVRAILALARSLRLEVVAEGVETDLQRGELEAMGCSHSQGYLFSRPLRPAEARALVLEDPRP